jgi:hypothetical protein
MASHNASLLKAAAQRLRRAEVKRWRLTSLSHPRRCSYLLQRFIFR